MNTEFDYKSFCETYLEAARQVADITIAEHIRKHGPLNPGIQVDNVKALGVEDGLKKAFDNYDGDHESRATVKTFLSRVVRNCTLSALKREGKEVCTNLPPDFSFESFAETFRTSDQSAKKEELIAKMLDCIKKLNREDQLLFQCWLDNPKGYIDNVLEELGWDDTPRTRNVVSVRFNRAIARLGKKMDAHRAEYHDVAENPAREKKEVLEHNIKRERTVKAELTSRIDYNRLAEILAERFGVVNSK